MNTPPPPPQQQAPRAPQRPQRGQRGQHVAGGRNLMQDYPPPAREQQRSTEPIWIQDREESRKTDE